MYSRLRNENVKCEQERTRILSNEVWLVTWYSIRLGVPEEKKKMGINETNKQTRSFPCIRCISYSHPLQGISTRSFHYWNSYTLPERQRAAACKEEMSVQREGG